MDEHDDRDRKADQRDRLAESRDRDAGRRDLREAVNDALLDGEPGQDARNRAAEIRKRSSDDRQGSARDRRASADDRAIAKATRDGELADVVDLDDRRDAAAG